MSEAAYLGAALPEPVRCLGQELEPYSLIHDMLLRQHRNIFVLSTQEFDALNPDADKILAHLFLGVFICCHSFPEVHRELRRADLGELGAKWRARAKREAINEAAEVRKFKSYCLAGQYCPQFEPIKRRGRRRQFSPRAPWLLLLFKTLVSKLNFTRTEALNCPLAEAHWLYLAHWESEGTVRILTAEEIEERRRTEKQIHAAAAEDGMQVMRFAPGAFAAIGTPQEDAAPLKEFQHRPATEAPV